MGIDVKAHASAEAKRLFRVDVAIGEFEEVYISFGKADCFFLNHGIEHIRNPKKLMNRMLHHLSKDGIIYMQHPVMPPSTVARVGATSIMRSWGTRNDWRNAGPWAMNAACISGSSGR